MAVTWFGYPESGQNFVVESLLLNLTNGISTTMGLIVIHYLIFVLIFPLFLLLCKLAGYQDSSIVWSFHNYRLIGRITVPSALDNSDLSKSRWN